MSRSRGIALFLTLGFTVILVMMLTATMTSSSGGNIFSQDYHRKTAALYVAETGLAMVQEELEANPNWTGGFNGRPTPMGTGRVWVSFGPSVNNLIPAAPGQYRSGPYGPVAPGSAYIKVRGEAQGRTEEIECIIGRKSEDFLSAAIVATDEIKFDEEVDISGRVSSEDLSLAEADVISNYDDYNGSGEPPVSWDDSSAPPTNRIAGTIRSASRPDESIGANLKGIADESLTDQAPVSVENVDIERAVRQKRGVPAGIPSIPTSPFHGEYYEGGDKTVAGDIILDNASLYVEGNLKVLGSIRGVGAVYVTGNTTLAGDSTILSNEDGVVLYSQGNVHLRGFDGTEWMDQVADARGITVAWEETKECMRRLSECLNEFADNPQFTATANPQLAPPSEAPVVTDPTADDYYWRSEAGLLIFFLGTDVSYFNPPGITQSNLLHTVTQVVFNEPSMGGEYDTQKFMEKKFRVLKDPVDTGTVLQDALGVNAEGANNELVEHFQDREHHLEGFVKSRGLQVELLLTAAVIHGDTLGPPRFTQYVGLTENELRRSLIKHAHWLKMYDFDRLGESYFQGNIYTRGAIYTSNEITLLGSLSAVADPDKPATPWTPPDRADEDAVNLRPGQVYLGHGTRIVHLGHLKPGLPSTTPPVGVVRWLR